MKNHGLWLSDFCQNVINNESPFSEHFKALFMLITMAQSPASYLIHQVFISLLYLPLPLQTMVRLSLSPVRRGRRKGSMPLLSQRNTSVSSEPPMGRRK